MFRAHDHSSDRAEDEEDEEDDKADQLNADETEQTLMTPTRSISGTGICKTSVQAWHAHVSHRPSSWRIPCTAQLFAVDVAASDTAHEMRFAPPDCAQDPVARLLEVLALATRMHAQVWPCSR